MMKHAKHISCRIKQGFSLAETLVALLIVVMLTGFVATGLPVAYNAYRQVVGDTNAQVAMSTTASALRDELGLAVAIGPVSDGVVLYQKADGTWVKIVNGSVGLEKHMYSDVPSGFSIASAKDLGTVGLISEKAIEGASGADDLRVQMVADASGNYITYADGVFTVNEIAVYRGSSADPIEHIDAYAVRKVLES